MPMVTSDPITLLNDVKPFKTTWKVEVKVLHSWTQHSSYSGGDSLQFILADKRGVKIHCTCKRLFYGRVKKLQASVETSLIFNFFNNMVVDVIGQAIDIGDIQVVPAQGGKETKKLELTLTDTEDQQVACCLRGQFAEQMLHTSKVAQVNQNFLCLLRFAKINVYKGQVQITNAFDSSTIEINPPGFDVQDYLQVLPNNDIALTTGSHEVAKTQGNKRPLDKWSTYPERSILDIIMATETEKCIVKGTIFAIDTDWAWFKLHLLIKDDTGETRVLLLDSIAEPILGVSAEVLLDGSLEEIEDPEDLSDAINDLIGKTFKFGVYVSKDNVDYGADIFNTGKTWSADEIISQSDDENTEDTLTNIALSDRSSGQVSLISIESGHHMFVFNSTIKTKRKQ
ncbi:uncharacterized protein LOC125592653 [Brassica napus]|uniref:uncharacterized protein LOC106314818 n=1 Tax=Brassica oleracea var. oleracea TaxID=109376 RepID=UPI0006A71381|nr:PREDICTED: uncharacterized protein LOC106314818 [Brassica oleracea var. oleracea]XP_048623936.1 uncharacterized protein LOC125592653 [Brassica napus]